MSGANKAWLIVIAAAMLCFACGRSARIANTEISPAPQPVASVPASDLNVPPLALATPIVSIAPPSARSSSPPAGHELYAAWYDVPPDSLAARRAGADELTAAHNHLPLGTRLRVTHLGSGRSVIVRVTDRGIPRGRAKLDLCRAAAEQLGMLGEGIARVRIEILPEDRALGGPVDLQTAAPEH